MRRSTSGPALRRQARNGYDPTLSGGSNLSSTSQTLITDITQRVDAERAANGDAPVPIELVTASASGLDPDISPPPPSTRWHALPKPAA